MSNLRNLFTSKDFIINCNMIKCIKDIDITLDEFLLILYFINISCNLDLEDIKDKLGFDDKKTFNAFNSLINKKYIDMIVENKNKQISEKIDLNPFYDRIALNMDISKNNSDIFALYEKELGRTLNSFEYEMINKWKESNVSDEMIKKALKEALLNGVSSFKYIDKIIYNWTKNDFKINKENESIDYFDYNWLEEGNE